MFELEHESIEDKQALKRKSGSAETLNCTLLTTLMVVE
jgi:hypothetical protein